MAVETQRRYGEDTTEIQRKHNRGNDPDITGITVENNSRDNRRHSNTITIAELITKISNKIDNRINSREKTG